MDKSDFNRWLEYTKSRRGKWTLDNVHNGENKPDFLFYKPDIQDQTKGCFVLITEAGEVMGGFYTEAYPHIGDSLMQNKWTKKFTQVAQALFFVATQIGISALVPLKDHHGISDAQVAVFRSNRK
jgi:hypothetical protein